MKWYNRYVHTSSTVCVKLQTQVGYLQVQDRTVEVVRSLRGDRWRYTASRWVGEMGHIVWHSSVSELSRWLRNQINEGQVPCT